MNIIGLLSSSDMISLVIISDDVETLRLSSKMDENNTKKDRGGGGIISITQETKEEIMDILNTIELSSSVTNHSKGFEYVFKKLYNLEKLEFIDTKQQPIQFVYVTSGFQLENRSEIGKVLKVIGHGQNLLKHPITINICLMISGKLYNNVLFLIL